MQINKVMVVDDDPGIRRIAELSLKKVGKWEVVLATCGQEALQLAPSVQPDIILLDVMMPGMDGPSVFKALREDPITARIPIVFLTAKVQPGEVDKYLALGCIGVISKPFDPITLPQQINLLTSVIENPALR